MRIWIPTLGRGSQQDTYDNLPREWQERVVFFCPEAELSLLPRVREKTQIVSEPKSVVGKGLSVKLQYILDNAEDEKIIIMDDDLKFACRHPAEKGDVQLFKAEPRDMDICLSLIERKLDNYVFGSISSREGNNRVEKSVTFVGRQMRVHAFNLPKVRSLGVRYDRVRCKQDFDITLQILRRGEPNFILWNYAQDHRGSNTPGGCSTYRTNSMMEEAAKRLQELHPDFVTLVKKKPWKGMTEERVDVRVAWKKAFLSVS